MNRKNRWRPWLALAALLASGSTWATHVTPTTVPITITKSKYSPVRWNGEEQLAIAPNGAGAEKIRAAKSARLKIPRKVNPEDTVTLPAPILKRPVPRGEWMNRLSRTG